MKTLKIILLGAAVVAAGACTGAAGPTDAPPIVEPPSTAPAGTSGDQDTTFDHDNTTDEDPWELLDRLEAEGPPEFSARLHSCPKMKYRALGNVLGTRGVDVANTTADSAGLIYRSSDQALGIANYAARVPESTDLTTASAAKMFDIFVAAAPEIIANMPGRAECQVGGIGASMFNAGGECTADGISCLIGMPATSTHVELCNQIIASASSPEQGRVIAVASLAAAAHTCE